MATAQEIIAAAQARQAAQGAPEAATQAVASSALNSSSMNLASTIPQAQQAPVQDAVQTKAAEVANQFRTKGHEFQHVYAGAGTIMDDGTRLTFGGAPGGNGRYVTTDEKEIDFLTKLSKTPGSQVTEIFRDADGREVVRGAESSLAEDVQRAREDAARNTQIDTDPAVNSARNNLGNAIKLNG